MVHQGNSSYKSVKKQECVLPKKPGKDPAACDGACVPVLAAGKFRKCLQIQMLRSASPSQFNAEISKDLKPRLEKTGDQGLLPVFLDYFSDKSFSNGTTLLALWEGVLPLA